MAFHCQCGFKESECSFEVCKHKKESKMFGVQTHLDIAICENTEDAIAKGYDYAKQNPSPTPVQISKVIVLKKGTESGKSTVDLQIEDEKGNKYIVMLTGALLRSIPTEF